MAPTRPIDAGLYAMLASFVLSDLLPGPTAMLAAAVALSSGIALPLDRVLARNLLAIFVGMVLGLLGVIVVALAHR